MQQGELTVTGQDYTTIPLRGFPTEIECRFKDSVAIIPCNPHHHDELEYEVVTVASGYVLRVTWTVSGVREVTWKVCY